MHRSLLLAPLALVIVAGCSNSPADVAGSYSINTTNGTNGCMLDNWDGQSATSVPLTIVQSGDSVTATLDGVAGAYFDLVVGSRAFSGAVRGDEISMTMHGTRTYTQGGCVWTIQVDADATVTGDFIEGTLTWTAATNHAPDCGIAETCMNLQAFNGTRPPRR